jgi:hypothetical protein
MSGWAWFGFLRNPTPIQTKPVFQFSFKIIYILSFVKQFEFFYLSFKPVLNLKIGFEPVYIQNPILNQF